jgi:predicted porin
MGSGTLGNQAGSVNGSIFNRGAEVNLSGAFGMVRIGKFDHRGGESTDINVVGNIGDATGTSNGNVTATGVEIGTDRNSTIAYRTPNLGFATIEVAHSQKAGQKTASADPADALGEGAVQSIYAEGTIAGINYRIGYAKQDRVTAVAALNNDATRQGLGISYNFGALSASFHYGEATMIDQTDNKEYTLSVNIPLGNGLDLRGVYQDFDSSIAAATSLDTADRTTYTVALAKALSKRTNLYAAYTNNDRTSTAAATAADSRRIFLGVGHNF